MLRLKELIDGQKSAPSKIQEKLSCLKSEWEQLLMRLEEIDASIRIEEANLIQLPKVIDQKKAEMTSRYNDLVAIRDQKKAMYSWIGHQR